MADENRTYQRASPFSFLELDEVQEYFASLNIELLRGKHIQRDDYYLFQLLRNFEEELTNFYRHLYGLELIKDKKDNEYFFYLDFPENGKGKLYDPSRHKLLNENQTIIGLMLLNMYYERYFEYPKEISWGDIKKEIMNGENNNLYKKLVFGEIRNNYTGKEWTNVLKIFKNTLKTFDQLGWISHVNLEEGEEIRFLLKESIYRLAKLYDNELQNFDSFIETYNLQKQK